MSSAQDKKRKRPVGTPRRNVPKQKRLRRAAAYHSSSEDSQASDAEEQGVQLGNFGTLPEHQHKGAHASDEDDGEEQDNEDGSLDADSASEEDTDNESTLSTTITKPKRSDPAAFATSMDKILNSKLTSQKRVDPVLSRSREAQQTIREQSEAKLENAARRKMRADKSSQREQGRVKDVMGLQSSEVSTGDVIEEERRLKKLAQRGVVKLFNAVRIAQSNAHEAEIRTKREGMVGIDRRKEKVDEMSKKGFLELLSGGRGGQQDLF